MKNILRVAEGIIIATIFITFLMCPALYAEEETLPTHEEIIAKNIEAIGGIKALKKIKNKKIVQIRKYDKIDIKDTIYQERPNNYYVVMDTGIREGSDGNMSWDLSPYSGPELLRGDVLAARLMRDLFDGPDGPDVPYKSMKTEGIEQINGKACYKVVKTPEKGSERTVYYNKNSYMIVKIISSPYPDAGTYIEEYQKINNILFPYKLVTIFFNGQKYFETTIEKIELNIEMPEGIFDVPEEIKAIMNKNETEPHAQQ